MIRHIKTALLAALFSIHFAPAAAPGLALAQDADGAFDTLSIAFFLIADAERGGFYDYWSSSPGFDLNLEMPFHLGRVEAGVQYAHFSAEAPPQPDFTSWFPYVGWGLDWQMPLRLDWYNGLRIGSSLMKFDIERGNEDELELGLAFNSRLKYSLPGAWALQLSGRYQVVFTQERLRQVLIAAGLSRSFGAPRWVKEFLE